MSADVHGFGVDFGSTRLVVSQAVLAEERLLPRLVRNELGGDATAAVVSFVGSERRVGEDAVSQVSVNGANTVTDLAVLLGAEDKAAAVPERRFALEGETVTFEGGRQLSLTQVLAMLLGKSKRQAEAAAGGAGVTSTVVAVPAAYTAARRAAVRDAARIAGCAAPQTVSNVEALFVRHLFQLQGGNDADVAEDAAPLAVGKVLYVDMGHSTTSLLVASVAERKKLAAATLAHGGRDFDNALFDAACKVAKSKLSLEIAPRSKAGYRLRAACNKSKKVLSTIASTQVSVECLQDDKDLSLTVSRDEMERACSGVTESLRAAIAKVLEEAGGDEVELVEVVGGGCRIPAVQQAIEAAAGKPVSFHLDGSSAIALGAALIAAGTVAASGFDADGDEGGMEQAALDAAIATEAELLEQDAEAAARAALVNKYEAYIYEMRGQCDSSKHKALIPESVRTILNEAEEWLWDAGESASKDDFATRLGELESKVQSEASAYFDKVEEERKALEKELEEEAAKHAGEEKEDRDFRKLKKSDRLKLAIKNKEEGNELLKGGVCNQAAERYVRALTHCTKLHDMTPEEEEQVKALKLSIYLNLSQCYIKLKAYAKAAENASYALEIKDDAVKALFRRGVANTELKKYEDAIKDLKKAKALNDADTLIGKALERAEKGKSIQDAKQKKMYSKMFG